MRANFIVSTTNSLEGYEIKKYYGICTERIVVGAGIFSEFFAGFTDIFGGRSAKFEANLKELYDTAMDKVITNAVKKGADALIGIKMDIDEISGKNTQMFMITVSGTAVSINSLHTSDGTDSFAGARTLSGVMIEKQIRTKLYTERLKNCTSITMFNELIGDMVNRNIILPLDLLLEIINDTKLDFTEYEVTDKLEEYFELYDMDLLDEKFYRLMVGNSKFTKTFVDIFKVFARPDYKVIGELADSLSVETLEKLILPVLRKFKDSYDREDAKYIEDICVKLDKRINTEVVDISKGMFNKDIWICACNRKVPLDREKCDCGKGKNGLFSEQEDAMKKAAALLKEILEVLRLESVWIEE